MVFEPRQIDELPSSAFDGDFCKKRCGQAWSKGCYGDVVDLGLDHASCRPCLLWLSYPKNWNEVMLSSWLDFVASAWSCTKGLLSGESSFFSEQRSEQRSSDGG